MNHGHALHLAKEKLGRNFLWRLNGKQLNTGKTLMIMIRNVPKDSAVLLAEARSMVQRRNSSLTMFQIKTTMQYLNANLKYYKN